MRARRKPIPRKRTPRTPREGFALLLAVVAVAIRAVLVTDLHETLPLR